MKFLYLFTILIVFFTSCGSDSLNDNNYCKDNPCKNNNIPNKTVCKPEDNGFICICEEGFEEKNGSCIKKKEDKCLKFNCPENSYCEEVNDEAVCFCKNGYEMQDNQCIKTEHSSFYKYWDNSDFKENSGNAVTIDNFANIYVAGYTAGKLQWSEEEQKEIPSYADTIILKYSIDGKLIWKKFNHDDIYDNPVGIVTDKDGNIFVAKEKGNDDFSAVLTKYDADGNKIWEKEWQCVNGLLLWDLKTDDDGFLYMSGRTYSHFQNTEATGGISDSFLIKIEDKGNTPKEVWIKQWGTSKMDEAKSIIVKNNKIYVLEENSGDTDIDNGSIMWNFSITEFDKNGNILSQNTILENQVDSYVADFIQDNNGNFYITGDTPKNFDGLENNGDNDIFILKYDQNYNKQWSKLIGTKYYDTSNTITITDEEGIFIGGHTYGAFDGFINQGEGIESDAFIIKIKKDGNIDWYKMFSGSNRLTGESVLDLTSYQNDLIFTGVLDLNYIGDTQNIESKGFLNKIIKDDYNEF